MTAPDLGTPPAMPPPLEHGFCQRYNRRFREWWEHHVCGWMEKHVIKSDETKGGQ